MSSLPDTSVIFLKNLYQLFCKFPNLDLSNSFLMTRFKINIFWPEYPVNGGTSATNTECMVLASQGKSSKQGGIEHAVGCALGEDSALC